MFTARQTVIAYRWTDMIDIYTTFRVALVFSATSLKYKTETKIISQFQLKYAVRSLLTTNLQRFLQRASSARVCN